MTSNAILERIWIDATRWEISDKLGRTLRWQGPLRTGQAVAVVKVGAQTFEFTIATREVEVGGRVIGMLSEHTMKCSTGWMARRLLHNLPSHRGWGDWHLIQGDERQVVRDAVFLKLAKEA